MTRRIRLWITAALAVAATALTLAAVRRAAGGAARSGRQPPAKARVRPWPLLAGQPSSPCSVPAARHWLIRAGQRA
jgi:hypothetical protein